jgi:hypothetical protein
VGRQRQTAWATARSNPSSRTMTLGLTQPLAEMSTRNLPGDKWRPALKPDNLTVICEPIVQKMWEPRLLTTIWASTAYYRDSCTLPSHKCDWLSLTLPLHNFSFVSVSLQTSRSDPRYLRFRSGPKFFSWAIRSLQTLPWSRDWVALQLMNSCGWLQNLINNSSSDWFMTF